MPAFAADDTLAAALTALLEDPPPLPGWPLRRWRALLGNARLDSAAPAALADARVHRVVTWAARRAPAVRRFGAVAAVLAVIDGAVADGRRDVPAVLHSVQAAVDSARRLDAVARPPARVIPSPWLDRRPAPSNTRPRGSRAAESALFATANRMLFGAGVRLHPDSLFATRLAAALDVAVEHWITGSEPGRGLPGFRPEGTLRSTKRLAVLLGADRDLLYLVYGPQPGRGRPLDVARRRGLAYWVAVAVRAEHTGEPAPKPTPDAVRHWRTEASRLAKAKSSGGTAAIDSLDIPVATGDDPYRQTVAARSGL